MVLGVSLLCQCSLFNPSSGAKDKDEKILGWSNTNLLVSENMQSDGSGIQKVISVKDYIFAMNAKTLKDGKKDFRMFVHKHNSSTWDSLHIPGRITPYSWAVDEDYLYVGTDTLGQLWRYEPDAKNWTNLELDVNPKFKITGVIADGNHIVISAGGFEAEFFPFLLKSKERSEWKDITNPNDSAYMAMVRGVEWNNAIYMATWSHGVKKFNLSTEEWESMPHPPVFNPINAPSLGLTTPLSRTLAVFNDQLWLGVLNNDGIFTLEADGWQRQDSCIAFRPNGSHPDDTYAASYSCNRPLDVFALATWNNYLFAAGTQSGMPYVYTGDRETKGWRPIDVKSLCYDVGGWCPYNRVYSITVSNDYLYMANWVGIYKFPLSQIEDAIENAAWGYPEYEEGALVYY
jgi:hypothetical protein